MLSMIITDKTCSIAVDNFFLPTITGFTKITNTLITVTRCIAPQTCVVENGICGSGDFCCKGLKCRGQYLEFEIVKDTATMS